MDSRWPKSTWSTRGFPSLRPFFLKLFWCVCVLANMFFMFKLRDVVYWTFHDEDIPQRIHLMTMVWLVVMGLLIRLHVWLCGNVMGDKEERDE